MFGYNANGREYFFRQSPMNMGVLYAATPQMAVMRQKYVLYDTVGKNKKTIPEKSGMA
ncbi:MAG: hypothetical protein MJ125_04110 [Clostridia bacterium]|nr:hypothetical protein [Clostridia bacterium]